MSVPIQLKQSNYKHYPVTLAILLCALLLHPFSNRALALVPVERRYSPQQLEDYQTRADHNDADAQAALADGYMHGIRPLKPDQDKAYEWLVKAATNGNAWAETNLGSFYERGNHVKTDYKRALKWYRKAADQQYPAAEDLIGKMYRDGRGVKRNYPLAAKYFKKAAMQLFRDGAVDLGCLYAKGGVGISKNYETAFFWLDIWENDAWPNVGFRNDLTFEVSHEGAYREVMTHLTPEQISNVHTRVKKWIAPPRTKWTPLFGHYHVTLPKDIDCVAADGSACVRSPDPGGH